MTWDLVEKIIVGLLVSAAAAYIGFRIFRSWTVRKSPCSGCTDASSKKGCEGCSWRKTFILVVLISTASTGFAAEPLKLTSPDIRPGGYIPPRFTCQRQDISPRFEFVNVPDKAQSLAMIVHDPDALSGDRVHWVVFNIPVTEFKVDEGVAPGMEGRNDFGSDSWKGPCPPSGTHHYIFEAYALDSELDLKKGANRDELVAAMQGHVMDKAAFVGLYEKF